MHAPSFTAGSSRGTAVSPRALAPRLPLPQRLRVTCAAQPPTQPAAAPPAVTLRRLRPVGLERPVGNPEEVLQKLRTWQAVLAEHDVRAAGGAWGSAGAVAALRRVARCVTIFDHRLGGRGVQSQARLARDRAAEARADARFAALAAAVAAALPRLDLHRLDATRSAFAALGHPAGVAACSAELAARVSAQRSLEELQSGDVEAVLDEAAAQAGAATLDARAAVAALRSLAAACRTGGADAAAVRADARFLALLAALASGSKALADDGAAAALGAMVELRVSDPQLGVLLVTALTRRSMALRSTQISPLVLLPALEAMRDLKLQPTPRSAAHLARCVAAALPTCPPARLARLLTDALGASLDAAILLPAVQPYLQAAVRKCSPSHGAALAAALREAGADTSALSLRKPVDAPAAAPPSAAGAASARRGLAASLRIAAPGAPLRRRASCLRAFRNAAPEPVEVEFDWRAAGIAFAVPALGGALFGYDIGITSEALVSLTNAASSGADWGPALSPIQTGAFVSASLAGAVLGSAAALTVGERTGRRAELLAAAALYLSGAGLMATASALPPLIAGRLLYGAGIGFAMHGAPLYIGETTPSSVRGAAISAKEGFIVGGILLGYVVGAVFVDADAGWRSMLGASALPALALGVGMFLLPDSPRWLLQAGKGREAAADALQRLRGKGPAQVAGELAGFSAPSPAAGGFGQLFEPRNARALYVGLSLMIFQQITGQPSVLYYATPILQRAGFPSAQGATQVAVLLGVFKLGMTLFAVFFVDKAGRRPLLLGGVGALTAALLLLAALSGDALPLGLSPDQAALASAGSLFLFVGAYQVSFGPIAWLLVSEIFPAEIRTAAVGLATIANFGSNFLVSLALPLLQEDLGPAGTYALFALLGGFALASIALTVPETKGRSLEEIQREIQGADE